MKIFLRGFFSILFIIGLGILVLGLGMHFTGIGIHTKIYIFFNDNPIGWVIMLGSIAIGAIGSYVMEKVEDRSYSYSNSNRYNSIYSEDESYCGDNDYENAHDNDYDSYSPTNYDNDDDSIGDRYDSDGNCIGHVADNGKYYNAEVDSDGGVHYYDDDGNEVDSNGDRLYF